MFQLKNQKVKESYVEALKQQMKDQKNSKYTDFEMDEREKMIHRTHLKQAVKNNPDRYKKMAGMD